MINKKAETNLTWLVIGIAGFITCVALFFTMYSTFLTNNNIQDNSKFYAAYQNISANNETLSTYTDSLENDKWKIVTAPVNFLTSTFTAIVFGLNAILGLLFIPDLLRSISTVIESVLPIPAELVWFIGIVIVIFIATKVIQAARGTIKPA